MTDLELNCTWFGVLTIFCSLSIGHWAFTDIVTMSSMSSLSVSCGNGQNLAKSSSVPIQFPIAPWSEHHQVVLYHGSSFVPRAAGLDCWSRLEGERTELDLNPDHLNPLIYGLFRVLRKEAENESLIRSERTIWKILAMDTIWRTWTY